MSSRVLLDTNIILRLSDQHSHQHSVIQKAIQVLIGQGANIVLAPQVLVEFWAVATRPIKDNGFGWDPVIVHKAITGLRSRFHVLPETPGLFQRWLDLVVQHKVCGKSIHDARIAAIALEHKTERLLTFNVQDFARFSGLTALSPAAVVDT